jgi:hypothetical protein
MAINVYKRQGIQDKGEWYDLASNAISYVFPVLNLVDRALVHVKAYSKTATNTPIITGSFSDESGNPVGSPFTTVDTDTGSTANFSELIVAVPVGATRINLQTTIACFAFVQPSQLAPFAPLNPTLFTTSQSITVGDTSPFTLLGGGAGGGGAGNASYFHAGGGGSGYLTFGSVNAGTYTLTIGVGGAGGSGGGGAGGTSSFSTFNALGGNPGGVGSSNGNGSTGGSGGSGGGGGANQSPSKATGNGGTNGAAGNTGNNANPGGAGSGVAALRFTAGDGGLGADSNRPGLGGGIYAGGGGGNLDSPSTAGGAANGFGGGGGSAKSNSQSARTGGAGGSGALWIILS